MFIQIIVFQWEFVLILIKKWLFNKTNCWTWERWRLSVFLFSVRIRISLIEMCCFIELIDFRFYLTYCSYAVEMFGSIAWIYLYISLFILWFWNVYDCILHTLRDTFIRYLYKTYFLFSFYFPSNFIVCTWWKSINQSINFSVIFIDISFEQSIERKKERTIQQDESLGEDMQSTCVHIDLYEYNL